MLIQQSGQTHLHHDIEQQDNVINSFGYNCDFLFHCPDIAFRLFEQSLSIFTWCDYANGEKLYLGKLLLFKLKSRQWLLKKIVGLGGNCYKRCKKTLGSLC